MGWRVGVGGGKKSRHHPGYTPAGKNKGKGGGVGVPLSQKLQLVRAKTSRCLFKCLFGWFSYFKKKKERQGWANILLITSTRNRKKKKETEKKEERKTKINNKIKKREKKTKMNFLYVTTGTKKGEPPPRPLSQWGG